ncbi:MAG: hypothetical protein HYZ48_02765 [Chlamydiales bacterium]|nr:hypothetical protein [Chlamydiales bacterium]
MLSFCFPPQFHLCSQKRLENCQIQHLPIEGKDIYILDDFFFPEEEKSVQDYSAHAGFSRNSYGSPEAIVKGEKPARSMDGKQRWQFFSKPPYPIYALYRLFSFLSDQLNAQISTLPWELCDSAGNGSPSVIGNFIEQASPESMLLGKHRDSNPQNGLPFAIPLLYSETPAFHPQSFENGTAGLPWIVTLMLYTHADNFQMDYKMGTTFYDSQDNPFSVASRNMRLVLFESDLFHTIESSDIPEEIATWRVSYVFKLLINPLKNENLKTRFQALIKTYGTQK